MSAEGRVKCPRCGHDDDMHWYPECPGAENVPNYEGKEFITTACRDCLPRQMYPLVGGHIDGGMCTMPRDVIRR